MDRRKVSAKLLPGHNILICVIIGSLSWNFIIHQVWFYWRA